ncbi:MAG: hypothetical protein AAFN80_07680 [Pseudomonadota bacterium]
MRSYQAARSYFGTLEFLSWCVIGLGAVAVIVGLGAVGQMGRGFGGSPSTAAYIGAIVPGAALAFAGFLGLVFSQIGRAGVDSAEYAQQSLDVARKQLEISRQALKLDRPGESGFAALTPKITAQKDVPAGASFASAAQTSQMPPETPQLEQAPQTETYNGHLIEFKDDKYLVAGRSFEFLIRAKEYVDTELVAKDTTTPREAIEYNGKTIEYDGVNYHFSKRVFSSLGNAQKYIDQLGVNSSAKLS